MLRELTGVWLGRRRYAPTYRLQLELFEARKRDDVGDLMLCLEHEPVITLGRGAKAEHLLDARDALGARGVDVEDTDRGGEITLHAPGQLVAYPIVQLAPDRCDVRRYVRDLMGTMRELIAPYGIDAGEMPGLVGLWVDAERPAAWRGHEGAARPAKIGAIGVRLSRWVTMHGFALNLAPDLSLFRSIVPCGVTQYGVCSMQSLGVTVPEVSDVAPLAWMRLAGRLGRGASNFVDASDVPDDELARWLMSTGRTSRVA
ncbi:MAG TPA: lipoyl(octanoyl) transferase LipB [Polyangiaceae bacterium]|nr:lipoyl(octanoyl) transferase LipB [Polyangiaceae bacterium]